LDLGDDEEPEPENIKTETEQFVEVVYISKHKYFLALRREEVKTQNSGKEDLMLKESIGVSNQLSYTQENENDNISISKAILKLYKISLNGEICEIKTAPIKTMESDFDYPCRLSIDPFEKFVSLQLSELHFVIYTDLDKFSENPKIQGKKNIQGKKVPKTRVGLVKVKGNMNHLNIETSIHQAPKAFSSISGILNHKPTSNATKSE
jgi:hypothetical protein